MKDYMFYNAADGSYLWAGTIDIEKEDLGTVCKNLLREINWTRKSYSSSAKITTILAKQTYSGVITSFTFLESEV